jgi:uncharacterized protein (TIGR02453 family)
MLQSKTLAFLSGLKKNNNREWFEKNRSVYETAKADVQKFVDDLIIELSKFDKSITGLEGKKCLFRINRDVRFSKNKAPYKSNFGASIKPGGKKSNIPGYYVHIDPSSAFLAGGIWMPESEQLSAIRQEIDYNFSEFKGIINNKNFKKHFGKLSQEDVLVNVPKGYVRDNPAADFLKLKSFIAYKEIGSKEVTSKIFLKNCSETFKAMYGLNIFLRKAMD